MQYQCELVLAKVFSFRKEQCSPPGSTGTTPVNQGSLSQTALKSLQFRLCLKSILGMAQHHCTGWSKPPLLVLCRSRHHEFRQLSFVIELQYQNAALDHEIINIKNILSEKEMFISSGCYLFVTHWTLLSLSPAEAVIGRNCWVQ